MLRSSWPTHIRRYVFNSYFAFILRERKDWKPDRESVSENWEELKDEKDYNKKYVL